MCACGKVTFETVENRLSLSVSEGSVALTASRAPNGTIKLEHLECSTCLTVYVGEPGPHAS